MANQQAQSNERQLSGKVIIVTGGTRNIGKASTLRLADLGYDIILTWNSSKNK